MADDSKTLDEVIADFADKGDDDPVLIARLIQEQHDAEWLAEQLLSDADEILRELVRRRIGYVRRHAETGLALQPSKPVVRAQLQRTQGWVPKVGWKKLADWTSDDFLARAAWYERIASESTRRASWCREIAQLMVEDGVAKLKDLKRDLPALPEAEGLLALES